MSDEPQTPTEVAGTYVNAVRTGDLNALRSVFADDVEMACGLRGAEPTQIGAASARDQHGCELSIFQCSVKCLGYL